MDAQSEKLQEVLTKNNPTEQKDTITAMKNILEGVNSRINETEK